MIDESFGTIPVKKDKDDYFVFLIQHRNGGHWGFPKGHQELKETPQESALRELKEETGLDFVKYLFKDPLIEKYTFLKNSKAISKTVQYFLIETTEDFYLDEQEILDGGWYSLKEAEKKITFPESKRLLEKAIALLHNY